MEPKLRTSKQSNAVKNALAAALTAGMLIAAPSNVKPAMAAPTTVAAPPTVSRSAAKRPSAARRTAAQDEGSLSASEQAAGAPPLPKGYAVGNVLNLVDPRKTGGRIVDNAQMFGSDGSLRSQEAQADITKAISKVEAEVEGSQILVVTVPSTPAGKSHKQFATELFNSVLGFHLRYADEKPNQVIKQWPVEKLVVSKQKTKAHEVGVMVMKFWSSLW